MARRKNPSEAVLPGIPKGQDNSCACFRTERQSGAARTLHGQDALVAEEVRALGLHQLPDPRLQHAEVELALEPREARRAGSLECT